MLNQDSFSHLQRDQTYFGISKKKKATLKLIERTRSTQLNQLLDHTTLDHTTLVKEPQTESTVCNTFPSQLREIKSKAITNGLLYEADEKQVLDFCQCGMNGHVIDDTAVLYHCQNRKHCATCSASYSRTKGEELADMWCSISTEIENITGKKPWHASLVFTLPKRISEEVSQSSNRDKIVSELFKSCNEAVSSTISDCLAETDPSVEAVRCGSSISYHGNSSKIPTEPNVHFHVALMGTVSVTRINRPNWSFEHFPYSHLSNAHHHMSRKWTEQVRKVCIRHNLAEPEYGTYLTVKMREIVDNSGSYEELANFCGYIVKSPWTNVNFGDLKAMSVSSWERIAQYHGGKGFQRLRSYGFLSNNLIGLTREALQLERAQVKHKRLVGKKSPFTVISQNRKGLLVLFTQVNSYGLQEILWTSNESAKRSTWKYRRLQEHPN